MVDIHIIEPPKQGDIAFHNVGRISGATGIRLTERRTEAGTFEVTIPTDARHADKPEIGLFLYLPEGDFWGIIDAVSMNRDAGGDYTTVRGRELKGLCKDRIILPPTFNAEIGAQGYDTQSGYTETIMKHYVTVNMMSSANQNRNIPGLIVAEDRHRGIAGDKYMARHEGLEEVLKALGEAAELGYDIRPNLNTGVLLFDVYEGEDRRATQSDRMRIVFDIERRTALSQSYELSREDAANLFYATKSGAEFEDEALTASYCLPEDEAAGVMPSGLARREVHLSVSSETETAGNEYAEMKRQVQLAMQGYRKAESFSCTIAETPYQYKRDYRIGDLVTVRNRTWGVTEDVRLTEMETAWSENGVTHTATFGKAPLNVFGRIKRQTKF